MNTNERIACGCGCGQTLDRYDNRGRERKIIHNHHAKFQPNSRRVVSCARCGKGLIRPAWQLRKVRLSFCDRVCHALFATENGIKRGRNNGHYNTIDRPCSGCGAIVSKARSLIVRRHGRIYCPTCKPTPRPGGRGFYVGYPKEFSGSLRTKIRKRDGYRCQECGLHQDQTKTLHVHHIDYHKMNNSPMNLISLCNVCHGATNFGTVAWETRYRTLMKARFPVGD